MEDRPKASIWCFLKCNRFRAFGCCRTGFFWAITDAGCLLLNNKPATQPPLQTRHWPLACKLDPTDVSASSPAGTDVAGFSGSVRVIVLKPCPRRALAAPAAPACWRGMRGAFFAKNQSIFLGGCQMRCRFAVNLQNSICLNPSNRWINSLKPLFWKNSTQGLFCTTQNQTSKLFSPPHHPPSNWSHIRNWYFSDTKAES